jgi:hypothetical protein
MVSQELGALAEFLALAGGRALDDRGAHFTPGCPAIAVL